MNKIYVCLTQEIVGKQAVSRLEIVKWDTL